jgi:hypothetical protein
MPILHTCPELFLSRMREAQMRLQKEHDARCKSGVLPSISQGTLATWESRRCRRHAAAAIRNEHQDATYELNVLTAKLHHVRAMLEIMPTIKDCETEEEVGQRTALNIERAALLTREKELREQNKGLQVSNPVVN